MEYGVWGMEMLYRGAKEDLKSVWNLCIFRMLEPSEMHENFL